MMRLVPRLALIAACLLLATTIPLHGRDKKKPDDYALIFGTVWGPDDKPMAGIQVNIRRAGQKKAQWQRYSTRFGEFSVRVPVGAADYIIWAETKNVKLSGGKHLQPSPQVTVHVDRNERVDTGLHLK